MATATDPIMDTLGGPWKAETHDRLDLIWRTITRDVQRLDGEAGLAGINSERWTTIDDKLTELGAMLIDELRDGDDYSETAELQVATDDIWTFIERRLIEFALEVEASRTLHRRANKPQLTPA